MSIRSRNNRKAVCSDHVYLCISVQPKLSVSEFIGYFKGKSALMLFAKHSEHESKWGRTFCER